MIKININRLTGFTLIELSIVILIVGLLLSSLLIPLRESVIAENRADTEKSLLAIENALYGFAIANGRLPCPDCRVAAGTCPGAGNVINDGIEDLVGNNCADPAPGIATHTTGNIPWATLAVPQFDSWQNWFSYSVDNFAADVIGSATPGPAGVNCTVNAENLATIDICAIGNHTIQNVGALCPSPPAVLPPTTIAQNVYAVVVSHGSNTVRSALGAGLINAPALCSENSNLDGDTTFVSSNYINPGFAGDTAITAPTPLGIDDQVIWISPHVLKNKLIQSGRLP